MLRVTCQGALSCGHFSSFSMPHCPLERGPGPYRPYISSWLLSFADFQPICLDVVTGNPGFGRLLLIGGSFIPPDLLHSLLAVGFPVRSSFSFWYSCTRYPQRSGHFWRWDVDSWRTWSFHISSLCTKFKWKVRLGPCAAAAIAYAQRYYREYLWRHVAQT